jgi:hypothetical protein
MIDERRSLLQRVVCGEASASDPAVQRALAADAELREELHQLLAVQARLAATARDERETLTAALDQPGAAPSFDAAAALRQAAGIGPRPVRRRAWLVAAAAVLLGGLGWVLWPRPEGPAVPDTPLGGSLRIVAWDRAGQGVRLAWRDGLEPGQRFVVRVYDLGGRMLGAPVSTDDDEWTFAGETVRGWPDRVRVAVERLDVTGLRPLDQAVEELHVPR